MLLNVENLETAFVTRSATIRAVNQISFQVQAGETVGIVGESGSGKSVAMLSAIRLIPSPPGRVTGSVQFEGQDLLTLSDRQIRQIRGNRLAMIFQDPMTSLNPVLTIERQISEGLRLHQGMSRSQARTRTVELLTKVGIPQADHRLHHYPHQFSGGMRQRVMIAMGLACHPQLLIADEPTTALDVTIQAQIVDLIKQLRRELGMAVLWITHDLALLAGLADQIVVMYAGRIVEQAPVRELYRTPRHPYTLGLLQSLPQFGQPSKRLASIPGFPPNLAEYPVGCPFASRCAFVQDQCWREHPPLEAIAPHHQVACWVKPDPNSDLRLQPFQSHA